MFFKVVFSYWVDWSEPIFDGVSKEEMEKVARRREVFLVEAGDEESARKYAKRFERLETNSSEGLGALLEVSAATLEEARELGRLSVYENYLLPKSVRLNLN